MRLHVAIVCAVLLVGCQSPNSIDVDIARIASWLERRITHGEARHIFHDDFERAVAQARAANHEDSRAELEVLAKQRQRRISKLESFLSRSRRGDELWVYRTCATADRRGGESGFVLVRDGRVVERLGVMIHD